MVATLSPVVSFSPVVSSALAARSALRSLSVLSVGLASVVKLGADQGQSLEQ
jgi:hypothetical protein